MRTFESIKAEVVTEVKRHIADFHSGKVPGLEIGNLAFLSASTVIGPHSNNVLTYDEAISIVKDMPELLKDASNQEYIAECISRIIQQCIVKDIIVQLGLYLMSDTLLE